MFSFPSENAYRQVLDGIGMKTRVYGEASLLAEFKLAAGSALPAHAHPNEQTGYLVSGRIRLRIGDKATELGPGGAWCVPPGVEHGAEALEASLAIEIFSPRREDYLQYLDAESAR